MADRIQQRHDTAANWNAANPILLEGEMGLITDTNQYKVGDGETRWNNLPLLGGAFVGNEINNLNTVTTLHTQQLNTINGDLLSIKQLLIDVDLLSYGILFDVNVSTPTVTRIGNSTYHRTLPIHNAMRRCLLNDNGEVVVYLDHNDSTKTINGEDADLTGASGMVMVEIPKHYRKFTQEGGIWKVLISEYPLSGYHEVPKMYRSAYEATVDRTVVSTPRLASVVNTSAQFRGGNNTADWDGTYRSLLGKPATSISLTNFRKYARNRGTAGRSGAGWNCDLYEARLAIYWLYVIEYANRNCQAAYNPELTSEGYRQGGLGAGVTTLNDNKWSAFNRSNPFVPCGTTNQLGNNTGVVTFTMPDEYDTGNVVNVSVPSYRGIENPFGHVWSWTDGCKAIIQSEASGGLSEFYVCDEPANFTSSGTANYQLRGVLPKKEGYVKALILGENGEILPLEVGGGSTTYFCDYFYTRIPESGVSERGVLFGGHVANGSYAGFVYGIISDTPSYADVFTGSRLCFLPTNN